MLNADLNTRVNGRHYEGRNCLAVTWLSLGIATSAELILRSLGMFRKFRGDLYN